MARSLLLPALLAAVGALVALRACSSAFVPAPATEVQVTQPQRFLQAAGPAAALAAANALPAFAAEIDAAEAYNRKNLEGASYVAAACLFLFGLLIQQARKMVENGWLK